MADTDSILSTADAQLIPRNEKKARQTLAKLGLKRVEGINRVVFRRPQGVLLVVAKPEVYRSVHSDCYIVFGDAKLEDPNSASAFGAQALAAAQAAEARQKAEQERQAKAGSRSEGAEGAKKPIDPFEGVEEGGDKKEEADDGDVDESGLDPDDIDTIVKQTKCSRSKAVKALREKGDIIDAIMACA